MKVIPSNQTLILASERGRKGASPYSAPPRADEDGVLTRVTLIAVQADYASPAQPRTVASWSAIESGDVVDPAPLPGPPALRQTSAAARSTPAGIALYDRVRRSPSDTHVRHIDVHA